MLPIRDALPTRRFPAVNVALIGANLTVFAWERVLMLMGVPGRSLVLEWGLVPGRFAHAPLAEASTVLSSMFLHDPTSWFHLAGNMLFLWIFGDNVEDALGRSRYLTFYLVCGLAAALGQVLVDPRSMTPMVGASGAVAGVLAAYGSLYPNSPVTVLNPVPLLWLFFGVFIKFPAWIVILEFFVFNVWNGLDSLGGAGGGVAFFAHLAGFVAGLFLVRAFLADAQDDRRFPPPGRRRAEA